MINKVFIMTKPGVFVQDSGAIPFQHHFSCNPAGLAGVDFCADRKEVLLTRMLHLLAVKAKITSPVTVLT